MAYELDQLKAMASLSANASKEATEQWMRAFYRTPSLDEVPQHIQDAVLDLCGGLDNYQELIAYIEEQRAIVESTFEATTGIAASEFVAAIETKIAAAKAADTKILGGK